MHANSAPVGLTATYRENAMQIKIIRARCAWVSLLFAALCLATAASWAADSPVPSPAPGVPAAPATKTEKPGKAGNAIVKLTVMDREQIKRVITLQIRAFERNDEAIAFSYATPESRRQFGTPRAFMDMVRVGYAALYKNTSREFLEAATIDGVTIQPLRVVTFDGETIVALYTMERQPDQDWRIGGCELAPATLNST
jgi:Domain of unknown function (DUF4864)